MRSDVRKILLMDQKTDRLTGTERTVPGTNGQTLLQTNRPWSKLTYPGPYSVYMDQIRPTGLL